MKNYSKHIFLLLSLLMCSSFLASAHKYLREGLSWESIDLSAMYKQYASEDHQHIPSTDEALFLNETLQGDTVINGKHYLICHFSYLNFLFTSPDGHSGCALRDDESGMYVYSFKAEQELLLQPYGLQVGDNVCTNPFYPGDEWLCAVESTDSIVLRNGERRRCVHLSDGNSLIEGLGSSKGLWGEGYGLPYVYFLSHSLGETSLHLSDNCDFVAQFKHEACEGIYNVSGHWTRLKIADNAGNECLLHLAVDNSGRSIDYESENTFAKVQLSRDADEWGSFAVYADAAGENRAFKIAVPADRYPVEVSWDGMSFCDAPWSGSMSFPKFSRHLPLPSLYIIHSPSGNP